MTSNTEEFFLDNPWDPIEGPCYPEGRRLYLHDERFWVSIDENNQLLFFIQESGAENVKPLENLAGLRVSIEPCGNEDFRLICRLTSQEVELIDKFTTVAKDIAFHCSEFNGAQLFVKTQERIKSWANFLKPSRSGLSHSEFVGFLGELYVLSEYLMQVVSPGDAVRSWIGPEGKKQDFTFKNSAIEVKTTISGNPKTIRISSLDQLDRVTEKLYLLRVVASPSGGDTGFCLGSLYENCLKLVSQDIVAERRFLQKATKLYGKASERQIKDHYLIVDVSVFEVDDEFPKITQNAVDAAIREVTYELSIGGIEEHKVSDSIKDIVTYG